MGNHASLRLGGRPIESDAPEVLAVAIFASQPGDIRHRASRGLLDEDSNDKGDCRAGVEPRHGEIDSLPTDVYMAVASRRPKGLEHLRQVVHRDDVRCSSISRVGDRYRELHDLTLGSDLVIAGHADERVSSTCFRTRG